MTNKTKTLTKIDSLIEEYRSLYYEYINLDSELNLSNFEDMIYYDSNGYFSFDIYNANNKDLFEAQMDLAYKIDKLKLIISGIKKLDKLMNQINPTYS
jgi:hypothetical protein